MWVINLPHLLAIFKMKTTTHSVKLFKFLESVFDLHSPPPLLTWKKFFSLLFWKHAVMGLTCSPLLGIAVRVGKLVGFPCYGNASVCKVLKCSGWKMTPPPPKDLCHTGFACWLESQGPHATCADVTLYGGQFTLSTQLIIQK